VQLRIYPQGALVAAAYMSNEIGVLQVEIANLRGDSLFKRAFNLPHGIALEDLAERIAASVDATIAASSFRKAAIHSLGLGLPGLVDSVNGVLHWLPAYGPGPAPLAALVRQRLQMPVFLDSTGNILTRAEHWFGAERQVDDFTMIFVGLGIAFGRYADGMLWRGDHGINPEFGHMKVSLADGAPCYCGARGCLWSYASNTGILSGAARRRGMAAPLEIQPQMQAFRALADEARGGEPIAREAFSLAGHALGMATASYVNLCDPSRILVVAQAPAWSELVEPPFRSALEASILAPLRVGVPVQFQTSDGAGFSNGAAALVLEQLYRGPPADWRH
jgi:predicted NBD/HSP70 family sugar kinase